MNGEMAELLGQLAARLDERRAQILHAKAAQARAASVIVKDPKSKKAMLRTAQFMDAEADAAAHMRRARKLKNGGPK